MSPRPELAARRKALGFSQESLAQLLEVRPQSVARWEQGTSTPLARHRRSLAKSLDVTLQELDLLIEVPSETPVLNGHAVPAWLDHYTSLEQGAGVLQTFEPISIPGLLQTEDYATAVMRSSHLEVSESTIQKRVKARIGRQAVFDRQPEPLRLICILDESVLHRVTGGSAVMASQLGHISTMVERGIAQVQIVSVRSSALHCASFGSFRLFTSAGATVPFMTCTEDLTGFNYRDRPDDVMAHTTLFEHLQSVALSRTESLALVDATRESYRRQT